MPYSEDFKRALLSEPHAILGKNRINDEFIKHIFKLLKRYKIIKIKVLKSAVHDTSIKTLAEELATATNSFLLDVRGKTFILSSTDINKNK